MKKRESGPKNPDRKTAEKNRRIHMKNLCYKLYSLVPSLFSQPFKLFTQESQFDQSTFYIEQLTQRIEVLKEKRDAALRLVNNGNKKDLGCKVEEDHSVASCDDIRLSTTVEVKEVDGGLLVVLTSKSGRHFSFSKVISIVEDGGAEVVKTGYITIGDKVIYTLHAMVRVTRIGIEMTSIHTKLQELINPCSLKY